MINLIFFHRYALTVWYFDETERQIAKTQQTNKGKEKIYNKMGKRYILYNV